MAMNIKAGRWGHVHRDDARRKKGSGCPGGSGWWIAIVHSTMTGEVIEKGPWRLTRQEAREDLGEMESETITGRSIVSQEPKLQNVPIRSPRGSTLGAKAVLK